MKKKKLVSMLLMATMCFSMLTGCGDTAEESGSSTPQSSQNESSNAGEETPVESGGSANGWDYSGVDSLANPDVKLVTYWDLDDASQAAVEAFEAKYGGTVTIEIISHARCMTFIPDAMATGDIMDLVFAEGDINMPSFVLKDYYLPIDQYLNYDACDEQSLNLFQYRDQHYVFTNAAISQPYMVLYNKTIFEEEGMKTPVELYDDGEWTYDKFLEYMVYFTRDNDGDGENDQWGLGPGFKYQNFGFANGAFPIYEVGNGELACGIDSEECLEWYEFLNKFGESYIGCPGDSDWLESRLCVMRSEAGPGVVINESYGSTDEFDFVPIPTYDGSPASTPMWDTGWAIVNGCPNPEGAAVLANMICEYKMAGYEDELAAKYTDVQIERYKSMVANGIPQKRISYSGIDIYADQNNAIDGMPPQTVVETHKSRLEAEIAAYNEALKQ
ncbi:MAG: extracellular solute-binding protein [Ruminococcus flavefaciens]|nr:extracellular solute-binding protein [Ruminococcus flavefaciens]